MTKKVFRAERAPLVLRFTCTCALVLLLLLAACSAGKSTHQRDNMEAAYERGDFEYLQGKADKGSADAQYLLSKMYRDGYGIEASEAMAFLWCKMAAERGHSRAQNNLGVMCVNGAGTARDESAGIKWFRKAANSGCGTACLNLGRLCETGRRTPRDLTKAVAWYERAWKNGESKGAYRLARLYKQGKVLAKDPYRAWLWRKRADALVREDLENRVAWFKASHGRAVLLLTADWCIHCRHLEKVLPMTVKRSGMEVIWLDYSDLDRLGIITKVLTESGFPREVTRAGLPTIVRESPTAEWDIFVGYWPDENTMRSRARPVPLSQVVSHP